MALSDGSACNCRAARRSASGLSNRGSSAEAGNFCVVAMVRNIIAVMALTRSGRGAANTRSNACNRVTLALSLCGIEA